MHRVLVVAFIALLIAGSRGEATAQNVGDDDGARRAIILGFDGVDPRRVREYMDAGELPNLKKLAERGTFDSLATTNPAESPVSWAAFSIGANPGKSGIFDFLERREGTYIPDIALVKREKFALPGWMRVVAPLGMAVVLGVIPLIIGLLFRSLLSGKSGRSLHPFYYLSPPIVLGVVSGVTTAIMMNAWIPAELPSAAPARQGTPFWHSAGEQDVRCCMIQVPVTFPAQDFPNGQLLSGLGTPDVCQSWGTYSVYATKFPSTWSDPVNDLADSMQKNPFGDAVTGGKLFHVEFPDGVRVETKTFLPGPENFTISEEELAKDLTLDRRVRPELTIAINRATNEATFSTGDGRGVSARAGEWTDWLSVVYELNPVFQFSGLVRFRVRSVAPEFYAYASPVSFHPAEPPLLVPLSTPFRYTREVTERTKHLHETVGWAIATNPLKDELIDEDEFLEDMRFSFDNRWRIIEKELEVPGWRLFTGVMLAPDRVQHMFLRYVDPEHPLYEENAPERFKNAIRDVYRRMDEIVGEVMEKHLDDRTDLWVISDHGFASFRKGVHLNSWLIENGFMKLSDPTVRERGRLDRITRGMPLANIDWSGTRAYSLGLGKIYLNRRGREPAGIVSDAEADAVAAEIRAKLLELRDPDTGGKVVREVYRREDIYRGEHVAKSAELIVGFEEGYRVSWDTASGNAPPGIIEENRNKWSGDHCSVDPSLVPGFIVTNRKLTVDDPSIIDVARTVLTTLDVKPPAEMEGRDLLR